MAQPDLVTSPTLRVIKPKPKMTIYYALLIIALVAMLTACLFLYLEIRRFGGFGTVKGRYSSFDKSNVLLHHGEPEVHRVDRTQLCSVHSVSSAVDS